MTKNHSHLAVGLPRKLQLQDIIEKEDLQDIFLFCYLQFFNTGMTFFVVEFLRIFVGG